MKGPQRKIIYVINDLRAGGAERLFTVIAEKLNRRKFEIYVVCLGNYGVFAKPIEDLGIPVISLNYKQFKISNIPITLSLIRVFRRLKPDIVHAQLHAANFHARIAGVICRVPTLLITLANIYHCKGHQIFFDRLLSYFTSQILAVSEEVKDSFIQRTWISPDKLTVLYNCVNIETLVPRRTKEEVYAEFQLTMDTHLIINVGSMSAQKGHTYLLLAFKKVLRRFPNTILMLVGDGPLRPSLEKQASKLGMSQQVLFLGIRMDVPDLLNASTLFVLPSLWEGMSLALIEAGVMGLPIVASDVSGVSVVVRDGESGFIVPPRTPALLAKKMVELLQSASLRNQFSTNVKHNTIATLSTDTFISRLENIYQKTYYPC